MYCQVFYPLSLTPSLSLSLSYITVNKHGEGLSTHRSKTLHVVNALLYLGRLHNHQHNKGKDREAKVIINTPKKHREHLEDEERSSSMLDEEFPEGRNRHVQIILTPLQLGRLERFLRMASRAQIGSVFLIVGEVQKVELQLVILNSPGDESKLLEVKAPIASFLEVIRPTQRIPVWIRTSNRRLQTIRSSEQRQHIQNQPDLQRRPICKLKRTLLTRWYCILIRNRRDQIQKKKESKWKKSTVPRTIQAPIVSIFQKLAIAIK